MCFPLAPHPRDVVADFVVACVVAHCLRLICRVKNRPNEIGTLASLRAILGKMKIKFDAAFKNRRYVAVIVVGAIVIAIPIFFLA